MKYFYSKADKIIANSKGNFKDLIENFNISKSKINLIYNPIDIDLIAQTKPIKKFYNNNYINLISVGSLNKNKNFILQINALKKINNKKLRLYILGEGLDRINLQNHINKNNLNNQIFLIGFVDNPYIYLKSAHAFIFSSLSEGLPNVLLEAIACKLPIITTNCYSGPDEILCGKILDNNSNIYTDFGILCPFNNLEKFSDAIENFIENKISWKEKVSSNYMSRINHFNIKKFTKEFLDIIN